MIEQYLEMKDPLRSLKKPLLQSKQFQSPKENDKAPFAILGIILIIVALNITIWFARKYLGVKMSFESEQMPQSSKVKSFMQFDSEEIQEDSNFLVWIIIDIIILQVAYLLWKWHSSKQSPAFIQKIFTR
ncbi:hypothetical protein FGO68_gene11293 [Halteria grandinella]|uniref:Uncharacterized protein n=1 Tax=Halteria grandinella TaxID=5974 RepID=A0A8J8NGX3_HALGN|nr:hypothetical protein FGO68_gene11293 [Halteria grandinella]